MEESCGSKEEERNFGGYTAEKPPFDVDLRSRFERGRRAGTKTLFK